MSVMPFPPRERTRFVDDLLRYMTLAEKLGQLDLERSATDPGIESAIAEGRVGGVIGTDNARHLQNAAIERSRLGIPLLIGVKAQESFGPWALAASWDEELAREAGRSAAAAAKAAGANWLLAPDLDLAGGEDQTVAPTLAGSDTYLLTQLAANYARGAVSASGGGTSGIGVAGTIRAEGFPEAAERGGAELARTPWLSGLDSAALDPGAAARAGFTGILSAQCRRLTRIVAEVFATTTSATLAAAAERAIANGFLSAMEIDTAVRGVLSAKHRLGLFRDPLTTIDQHTDAPILDAAEATRRTMVLLRNEGGLLPLSPVSDRVLMVGSLEGAGAACAEALQRSGIGFMAAPGLSLRGNTGSWSVLEPQDQLALALTRDAAQRADFVLIALEERHFDNRGDGTWPRPTAPTVAMVRALSRTSARLVALIATAGPVDLGEADRHFAAALQCWQPRPGFEDALGKILAGTESPQGRLPAAVSHFPGGHGLGFGDCVVSSFRLHAEAHQVVASARVRNAGTFPMRETVQVYVRDQAGDLRLVAYEQLSLKPEEDVPVRIVLGAAALGIVGALGRFEVAPGRHEILLGKSTSRLLPAAIDLSPQTARAIAVGRAIALRSSG